MAQNLPQWEVEFNECMEKVGSKEVYELDAEINKLYNLTEEQVETKKIVVTNKLKEIEPHIQYLEEQEHVVKLKATIKELNKEIRRHKYKLDKAKKENDAEGVQEAETALKETEEKKEAIETELRPYERIINGLHRKIRIINNRLKRSVFSGFGSVIKARREELGYSLKDLEKMTGISPSYINRIEKGERKAPSYKIMEQLAVALDIPISKLTNIAKQRVETDVPSIEELILTSQFTINGKRVTKIDREKIVEFIRKLNEVSWEPDKKYQEYVPFMAYFDYFKENFPAKE